MDGSFKVRNPQPLEGMIMNDNLEGSLMALVNRVAMLYAINFPTNNSTASPVDIDTYLSLCKLEDQGLDVNSALEQINGERAVSDYKSFKAKNSERPVDSLGVEEEVNQSDAPEESKYEVLMQLISHMAMLYAVGIKPDVFVYESLVACEEDGLKVKDKLKMLHDKDGVSALEGYLDYLNLVTISLIEGIDLKQVIPKRIFQGTEISLRELQELLGLKMDELRGLRSARDVCYFLQQEYYARWMAGSAKFLKPTS